MSPTRLTELPFVKDKIEKLRVLQPVVSDIIDDKGHQYVDLVMEGGGTLGMALLGYIYTLESAGIRFLSVGGVSAGSILALLLAAGRIDEPQVPWILKAIKDKNFWDFIDGDKDSRNFIKNIVEQENSADSESSISDTMRKAWYFMCIIDNLSNSKKGLNPGTHFHEWLIALLKERNIQTLKDLNDIRSKKPAGLKNRATGLPIDDDEFYDGKFAELGIIAADVTTETKVVFPRMANLYWKDPNNVNPADFVRASMSIPIFFQPFEVKHLPKTDDVLRIWRKELNYQGGIPEKVVFVDGGVISNFPIDIFHDYSKIPSSPTLGVKIGYDRTHCNHTRSFLDFLGAIFWSSAHCLDNDFIFRNPDFKQLVSYIDYNSKRHGWLKFAMDEDDKDELFKNGVDAAYTFLTSFNWMKYKQSRQCFEKVTV